MSTFRNHCCSLIPLPTLWISSCSSSSSEIRCHQPPQVLRRSEGKSEGGLLKITTFAEEAEHAAQPLLVFTAMWVVAQQPWVRLSYIKMTLDTKNAACKERALKLVLWVMSPPNGLFRSYGLQKSLQLLTLPSVLDICIPRHILWFNLPALMSLHSVVVM